MEPFFIKTNPPTATAQERRVRIAGGRPQFYDPPKIKAARELLCIHLRKHRPPKPLEGPLRLHTVWCFPKGKSHKDGEWRITRPDTDNLQKLLKDCMTVCGYWADDAQVVCEIAEKLWSSEPAGIYIDIGELEKTHRGPYRAPDTEGMKKGDGDA